MSEALYLDLGGVMTGYRVLGSGPHTPTQFFWEQPRGFFTAPPDLSQDPALLRCSLYKWSLQ